MNILDDFSFLAEIFRILNYPSLSQKKWSKSFFQAEFSGDSEKTSFVHKKLFFDQMRLLKTQVKFVLRNP